MENHQEDILVSATLWIRPERGTAGYRPRAMWSDDADIATTAWPLEASNSGARSWCHSIMLGHHSRGCPQTWQPLPSEWQVEIHTSSLLYTNPQRGQSDMSSPTMKRCRRCTPQWPSSAALRWGVSSMATKAKR
jgi:hypothetical protein